MKGSSSIAARIAQTGGHATGFDYLRLCLALFIVCQHAGMTSYGMHADVALFESPARPLFRFILPAFFALSGFLVAGSLERSRTLLMFLGLRVLRINPALAVQVLLSAFILGPLLTTVPLSSYFTAPAFFLYLRNAVGDVYLALPGLFQNNPLPNVVNGQLWTIPFELYCYITLAGMVLIGLRRHRVMAPVAAVLVTLAYLFTTLLRHHWKVVPVPGSVNGALLIATFMFGVSLYLYRELLPLNRVTAVTSAVLTLLLLDRFPYGDFLAPLPAAYFTIHLGMLNPSRKWLMGADYSYGIYLYGFTIQQAVVCVFPIARAWQWNIMINVPLVVLFAAVSWHFVEKPAQRLRIVLKWMEAKLLSKKLPETIEAKDANPPAEISLAGPVD